MTEDGQVKLAFESGFFICGNDVFDLDLPAIEKLLYIDLIRYAGSKNRAWPSFETLARDAGCSPRKAKYAIAVLIESKLVAKERRGNRSNLYIVYPPKFYCKTEEEKSTVHQMHIVDEKKPIVHDVHNESAPDAPPLCTTCTTDVHHVHKINNNNIINNNNTNKQAEKEEESNLCINELDMDAVKKAFKAKHVAAKDKVILNLLEHYPVKDIKAAIKSTDFEKARNPIAVIKWMLKEGSYVMPAENTAAAVIPEYNDEPVDYEFAKTALREAKALVNQ
jgi:anti-sigma28 factor (negative regulator of flagellin synthesis)